MTISITPKISIIIPTRNRRAMLEATIDSVRAQRFAQWELLVVDDASEDDTWPWLQSLGDERIHAHRLAEHAERSVARNLGLAQARGEFVLFLDDDDLLFENALQAHLKAFAKFPNAVAAIGGYRAFDERGPRQSCRLVRRLTAQSIWQDVLFGWMAVSGQCLFRAEALRSFGGWHGEFIPIEDHQLLLRLARLGPVALLPEMVLQYRVHEGQWRPPRLWKLMTKVRERAVKKLADEERQTAERILQAREQCRLAAKHAQRHEARRTLSGYAKAARLAPILLRSPLARPLLLKPMLQSCGMMFNPARARVRKNAGLEAQRDREEAAENLRAVYAIDSAQIERVGP